MDQPCCVCGRENEPGALFCWHCGWDLAVEPDPRQMLLTFVMHYAVLSFFAYVFVLSSAPIALSWAVVGVAIWFYRWHARPVAQ